MTYIRFNRQRTNSITQSREVVGTQSVGNLKDIEITSPTEDQILKYNATAGKFVNVDLSEIQANIDEVDGGTY